MKAWVITTRADRSVIEAGVTMTEEVLVPNARQQAGYRGYVGLYDLDREIGLAITLWDDEESERESDRALEATLTELAPRFNAEVEVSTYDVAIVDTVG